MKFINKLCLIVFSLCLIPFSYAQNQSQQIHEYQFKNGLKLIVKEDHRAPVATLQVWYKVGSVYEPDGITGISHALEHMMFRGSKNYSAEKFLQTVAENGGQQNAFTYYDYTGYYETMGADKLPIAFKLEADRMRNLSLRAEDFSKEIQVVMEERRMRIEDNPQQLMLERFLAAANIASPYHHPVIGWMNDIQNLTAEDLRKWYETWYAPNNAIVIVVGDVNPEQINQLTEQYFGPLQPATIPALKPQKEVPSLGLRTVEVAAPAKVPDLLLGYNVPVVNTAQEKWQPYALFVLSQVLGGSDSSRLQKNLVRDKQIAGTVNVDYEPYFLKDTVFVIESIPVPGHSVDELKNGILNEIKQLQDQPVTADELERAKAQIISSRVYQEDSIEFQAYEIGTLETVGISWREIANAIQQIKAITPQQVQAVAKEYLISKNLTVGTLKPLPMPANQPQMQPMNSGDQHVR